MRTMFIAFIFLMWWCIERENKLKKMLQRQNKRHAFTRWLEATKSIRYICCLMAFFSSLARNLITILINLWLHRCQWLVTFLLCSFLWCFSLFRCEYNYVCVCVFVLHAWYLGERTFVHWLPVRVPAAATYIETMVRLELFEYVVAWYVWLHSWCMAVGLCTGLCVTLRQWWLHVLQLIQIALETA